MRIGFQMVTVPPPCQAEPPYLQQHQAGLRAARLAVAQILSIPARGDEVEITPDSLGAPRLHLHGGAAELALRLGLVHWHLSISHTDHYAAALVVAENS